MENENWFNQICFFTKNPKYKMKRLFQKIKALFIRIKPQFQNTIETAVIVVQKVKDIINNPSVDVLTALTPFEQDERILKALRSAIGYVSDMLSIADTDKSPSEQLKQIAAVLNERHPQFKKLFYRELAAALAHSLSDGKLTAWELFTLTQTAYKAIKENDLDTSNIENEEIDSND
jgi:hypothetical protein